MRNMLRNAAYLGAALLVLTAPLAAADVPSDGWAERFTRTMSVEASGLYHADQPWTFESFSALEMEPSSTAHFVVRDDLHRSLADVQSRSRLVVSETRPGLRPNPHGSEPFFERAQGAISALGWVDRMYTDLLISGDVNVEGGRDGTGSSSRQGLMARWDKANNFYWFHVNFATGEYSIWRSRHLAVQVTLDGSRGAIQGFDARRPYHLTLELVGNRLRGNVYEYRADGSRRLVGDTGEIRDAEPQTRGVGGFIAELAFEAPFVPLEGSFANLRIQSLRAPTGPRPRPVSAEQRQVHPPSTPAAVREARTLWAGGDLASAAGRYRATLDDYPDHVTTLQEYAWLLATADDVSVRDGERAVEIATRALDAAMRSNSLRHESDVAVVYPRLYFAKLGYTLAAAYASANRIFAAVEEMQQGDTDSSSGYYALTWALEMARHEDERRGTEETRELVRFGEQALESLAVGQPLVGLRMPGMPSAETRGLTVNRATGTR